MKTFPLTFCIGVFLQAAKKKNKPVPVIQRPGLWHQRLGHLNKGDVKRNIGCKDKLKEVGETCAIK